MMWILQIISILILLKASFSLPENRGFEVKLCALYGTCPTSRPIETTTESSEEEECECTPFYMCEDAPITKTGQFHIDPRMSPICTKELEVCCNTSKIVGWEDRVTPAPSVRRGCGYRNSKGIGFKYEGEANSQAQFGEFPWMVAIFKEIMEKGQPVTAYGCGGSLIHPQAILTAAHCVVEKTPQQLTVRAGEWDFHTTNEPLPHQDRAVMKIIFHPKFKIRTLLNDFAILILAQPFEIAENVNIICLPNHGDVFDNLECVASGWGQDVFGDKGKYQSILKRIELPAINRDVCQHSLRSTRLGDLFELHESLICAGGEAGKDPCEGDGGSPLVCPLRGEPGRYAQAGIVAWGIGCGEKGVPGVYANVAGVRPWIDQQLTKNNLHHSE